MIDRLNRFFDFTTVQLRFVVFLCGTALVIGVYLFIRSYAAPTSTAIALPVFLGDADQKVTGLFVLDPNTSPADSLELLPGIGRVLSDRIVEYRQHTRFETEIDITAVNGIGPKSFEKIRPYLKVRGQ
ncbi:MAG: hypothetical protein DRP45_04265 [Candidatus Zixiibacteriota bacterium]|nr:MAG: hypothetical protein DRP45_04265 [candidate division Zixibacteria bacterium]